MPGALWLTPDKAWEVGWTTRGKCVQPCACVCVCVCEFLCVFVCVYGGGSTFPNNHLDCTSCIHLSPLENLFQHIKHDPLACLGQQGCNIYN